MIDPTHFKDWLQANSGYSTDVISDNVSRMRRADSILPYDKSETYLFFLERNESFKALSPSVRSQIRKAVKLYEMCVSSEQ